MYKDNCQKLITICSHTDVPQQHKNLNDVLDMANYITSLFEAHQEREKLIEKNSAPGSLKDFILEKYNPTGLDWFIKYKAFIEEFKEFILGKPLSH